MMKNLFLVCLAVSVFASCNNSSENKPENPIDSVEERQDTINKNIDSSFDAKIDSLEKRKDELKDKFDSTFDKKKDSLKKAEKKKS
jgi:peptidoglycan hydrolase CwlO-like protein